MCSIMECHLDLQDCRCTENFQAKISYSLKYFEYYQGINIRKHQTSHNKKTFKFHKPHRSKF